MRFAKVSTLYPKFRKELMQESNFPQTYAEMLDRLWSKKFAWSNFFQIELNKIGIESFEVVLGWSELDEAWRRENHAQSHPVWISELIRLKPNFILLQDVSPVSITDIKFLRENIPDLKAIWVWHAIAPSDLDWQRLHACDGVLTCSVALQELYRERGLKTQLMYHAFEPSVGIGLSREPRIPVSFVGSFLPGEGFHQKRMELILRLIREIPEFEIYGNIPSVPNLALKKIFSTLGDLGLPLPGNLARYHGITWFDVLSTKLRKASHPSVFGQSYFQILGRSEISINQHIDVAGNFAANVRLFEATGMGSCLVTDAKKNLNELFEVGREVVAFDNSEDCTQKIKYLLDHPVEAREIADRGKKRCLRDHTFSARSTELKQLIECEVREA